MYICIILFSCQKPNCYNAYLVLPLELPLQEQLLLLQEQLVTGLTGLRAAETGSTGYRRLLCVWRSLQQESLHKENVKTQHALDHSFATVVRDLQSE